MKELLAELARAAYLVAEQHNFQGAFIDTELDLWYAHCSRLDRQSGGSPVQGPAAGGRLEAVA